MPKSTRVQVGDLAPSFVRKDVMGRSLSLEQLKGRKSLALVFLRYFGCPLCQVALQQFRSAYPEFETKNAELAIVLQSPAATILESGDAGMFPFRLIPDPEGSLYRQYAVGRANLLMVPRSMVLAFNYFIKGYRPGKSEGDAWQLPGSFVIDKEGVVHFAYVGKHMGDSPAPDKLLSCL